MQNLKVIAVILRSEGCKKVWFLSPPLSVLSTGCGWLKLGWWGLKVSETMPSWTMKISLMFTLHWINPTIKPRINFSFPLKLKSMHISTFASLSGKRWQSSCTRTLKNEIFIAVVAWHQIKNSIWRVLITIFFPQSIRSFNKILFVRIQLQNGEMKLFLLAINLCSSFHFPLLAGRLSRSAMNLFVSKNFQGEAIPSVRTFPTKPE